MKWALYILILLPNLLLAQLTDNFSDGNLLNNPSWEGDTSSWLIVNGQLRSNGPAFTPTVLYLSTKSTLAYDCQWEFFANPKLATSSGNFMDVFLVSDQKNLNSNLNGYFIRIGGTKDEISLYKKNGAVLTKIIDGSDKLVSSSSNNPFKIKIIRTSNYEWSLETDKTGSGINYEIQGNAIDSSFNSSSYLGVLIHYSAANSKKYFFDDFYAGPIIIDSIAPFVSKVKLVSSNELDIYFNEPVNQALAENTLNYFEMGGIGYPTEANRDNSNASLVHLSFANPFLSGIPDSISIKNIKDLAKNSMLASYSSFLYYRAMKYDVVFNEIMPDPSPVIALPEQEYIELYNKTSFPISLSNWTLEYGNVSRIIPEALILPDSFLLLCALDAFPDLEHIGNCIALPELSASALINGGTSLSLKDQTGTIIHSISYNSNWYWNDDKKEGGWAIEQIDPLNPCGDAANWTASTNYSGGTPGCKNSVFAKNTDTTNPEISEICINDSLNIEVLFSEIISNVNADNILGYEINPEIGKPLLASLNGNLTNSVKLSLPKPISKNTAYTLSLSNAISDCSGNKLTSFKNFEFSRYQAEEYDIVINEIMANPNSFNGLPNQEYIELYNRSKLPVNLKSWKIGIGNYMYEIPCVNIAAGNFLIITNKINEAAFAPFGKTCGINSMGILANEGSHIWLKNNNNELVSSIKYSDSWYKNQNKIKGGWALEQIDANNVCAGSSNWTASCDKNGGSPGKTNSVNEINNDNDLPQLLRASIIDSVNLKLHFNEKLNKISLLHPSNFTIDHEIGSPVSVISANEDFSSFNLQLTNQLFPGNIYTIKIKDSIIDCAGNFLEQNSTAKFAFPEKPETGDIIINEVLFNPKLNGADFVEIYNRSSKIIDLKDLQLSGIDPNTNEITSSTVIDTTGYLFFPEDYIVLTDDADNIKTRYYTENKNGFIEISSMPDYNNTEGNVVINKINEEIIDQLYYTEKMQFPLLNSFEGISLERINPNRLTNDISNWHSSGQTNGFATPAYRNSQYSNSAESKNNISIDPILFSPDNDGNNDIININYIFENSGNIANAAVYNENGQVIKFLLKNELLGTKGTFSWDGINESNEKSPIGSYIMFFSVYDLKGNLKKYKYNCFLAGKL